MENYKNFIENENELDNEFDKVLDDFFNKNKDTLDKLADSFLETVVSLFLEDNNKNEKTAEKTKNEEKNNEISCIKYLNNTISIVYKDNTKLKMKVCENDTVDYITALLISYHELGEKEFNKVFNNNFTYKYNVKHVTDKITYISKTNFIKQDENNEKTFSLEDYLEDYLNFLANIKIPED